MSGGGHGSRGLRWMVALGTLALLITACGSGGTDRSGPEEPCVMPSVGSANLSLLPKELPFAELGTVTQAEVESGFLGATVVSRTPIVELYPPIARAILDAGYVILASDNEGFEAEIYFGGPKDLDGAYRMREGPCGDQVTIKLLLGAPRFRDGKEAG